MSAVQRIDGVEINGRGCDDDGDDGSSNDDVGGGDCEQ